MRWHLQHARTWAWRRSAGALIARAVLCVAGGAILCSAQGADLKASEAEQRSAQLALGQRIYREGILPSGEPLTAQGAAQTRLSGKEVACAACHRRSGHGTTEGKFAIRPITAPALLQEDTVAVRNPRIKAQLGTHTRPPYTPELLARAIRSGADAAGKPLDRLMPRYALSDEHMQALIAYLLSLSAQNSPGVDEEDIHFAAVIQPGVTPARRRAMLDIMQAFVKDKNANVRSEEQRRQAGTMRMYRSYRKWVLHMWELNGPGDTWDAQLDAFYRKQPVFALIGGLGDASWVPIHGFCERLEIPSVFPQVDQPALSGSNHYTVYFSKGAVLDAEVLARFLRDQPELGRVVQVYRREQAGAVAAASFRAAMPGGTALTDEVLDGSPGEAFWTRVWAARPAVLILWLGTQDLAGMQPTADGPTPTVYLPSSVEPARIPDAVHKSGAQLRLLYPSDLSPKRETRLLRSKFWLHSKGIPITEEVVQMNTLFTMTVVSDVVGHIMDSFSRDLFVERIEHVVGQTPMSSVFQSVSLGPGQRFAAKGSSVVQVLNADPKQLKALSGWIVP